jgi:hypothetical protein
LSSLFQVALHPPSYPRQVATPIVDFLDTNDFFVNASWSEKDETLTFVANITVPRPSTFQ